MSNKTPASAQVQYITIDESHAGQRLDNFLLGTLKGVPRTFIYRVIRKGEVRVNRSRAKPSTRLQDGDEVRVPPVRTAHRGSLPRGLAKKWEKSLSIPIYEDDHLLVVDKPAGLPVHAGSGVAAGLIEIIRELRQDTPYLELAHRLDRGTSGCLLLAKKRNILKELNNLFKVNTYSNSVLDKRYLALISGRLTESTDVRLALKKIIPQSGERIVVPDPEGQYAHSRFIPETNFDIATLVSVKLYTGRTHQVRVHAQSMGRPVAGDEKYGSDTFNQQMGGIGLKRLFLHAQSLSFVHPGSGQRLEVVSPLPDDLANVLDRIKPGPG